MMISEIAVCEFEWVAARLARPANPGRREVRVGVQSEEYRFRGERRVRPKKGTGRVATLPEVVLRRRGFEVFQPKRKVWDRRAVRFHRPAQLVEVPLIPGWIFVGWEAGADRWADLMATGMVVGVCGTGGMPIFLAEAQVMRLMRLWGGTLAPETHQYMRRHAEFAVGDVARVAIGPFEGCSIEVLEIDGPSTRGLIKALGGRIEVEMPTEAVEKC